MVLFLRMKICISRVFCDFVVIKFLFNRFSYCKHCEDTVRIKWVNYIIFSSSTNSVWHILSGSQPYHAPKLMWSRLLKYFLFDIFCRRVSLRYTDVFVKIVHCVCLYTFLHYLWTCSDHLISVKLKISKVFIL